MKTDTVYLCQVCGLVYDPAEGRPGEGLPAGTPWSAVPDTWRCPECGVPRHDFVTTTWQDDTGHP